MQTILIAKVIKNECRVVGSSDPTCHSLADVLRSCSGSILCVLQSGSSFCTQERNEKRAGLAKLRFGLCEPGRPIYTYNPDPHSFSSPLHEKTLTNNDRCDPFLHSSVLSFKTAAVVAFLPPPRFETTLTKNDGRVPFSGKDLTVVHSLPSPKPVFIFFSITHNSVFNYFLS